MSYRIYGEESERSWPLNPLPLILGQKEWAQIARGGAAGDPDGSAAGRPLWRGQAGSRWIAAGRRPDRQRRFRARHAGVSPGGRHLQIYAADLGRGPDGRWWVLDDRTQARRGRLRPGEPAGFEPRLSQPLQRHERRAPGAFFDGFRRGLAAAADRTDPRICLLSPGPFSETYFEQAHLARYLGFLLVEGDDLVARTGGSMCAPSPG
uniref:Circularly permuted type 2 ATP-grasp protein n=1 Tax=Phenylobacterium glaciei TaxID=2803784 RepID=A0A974S9N2_9CAUL|nr:circularly permuted type 2 ATP-grasp protein [Phenylobacterium glaciei]